MPGAPAPFVRRWGALVERRHWRRDRRAALPGLVESIASALGSGLSLPQAFAEVAPALPAALAAPTRRVAASLALGVRLDDALVAYRGTVADEDVAPIAIVLGAFTRAGGRVSRSLARVASLLRGRLALADEQAALTAQGRVSAAVLVLLAPLGAVFFAFSMPDYVAILVGPGRAMLGAAVVLEAIAAIWLRRLLRVPTTGSALASLLDAVVVGLDSGMTFEQALRALVVRAPAVGRLPEARRLLADLALGQGARRAFGAFAASGPAEARVAALIASSTRFGAPLADLLVIQADALRDADRRRAEAAARRLPVLMLFPLTFCVLPALLIVFLGPPLLSLVQ
ncbi:MAG: type II secretion system F family protein [Chloroflexi bacterium]|nr:type II secretion system F family protein [Chloroflexota bacterium]